MLEIHQRYVLDEAGETIAVQIPIAQFEKLLQMIPGEDQVSIVTDDDLGLSVTELQTLATVGLAAAELGQYKDYDEAEIPDLFAKIRREGRTKRGLTA
jgi:hypothetical protein